MNDMLDWSRIQHLLKVGNLASFIVLTGDMLLGWGASDPSVTALPAMFTRYLSIWTVKKPLVSHTGALGRAVPLGKAGTR